MQRKTVWLIVICVVVLSLVLASCAPAAPTAPTVPTAPITPTLPTAPTTPIAPATPVAPSTETPKYGGQLAIAPLGRWTGFDLLYRSVSGYYPIGQTNETLLSGDWAKGPAGSNENDWATASPIISHMTGYLAESWELPDAETIIIHLRKGIHWALNPRFEASRLVNGREVVANDIVYTIVKTYTAPGAYLLTRTMPEERPVSTTASDKYTVIIKTQKGFLGSLFQRVGSSTGYWPSEPREKYGDMRDWKSTVGSGPFMIEDYVDASTITLIRNPNYWQKNPVGLDKGNQLPYVDGVKIFSITDKSTRAAAFRTGKLDHLGGRSGGLVAEDVNNLVQSNPGSMTKALAGAAFGIRLRMDRPELPWNDIRVRRALNMALDRETIVKDYYRGNANLTNYPTTPYRMYVTLGVAKQLNEWPEVFQEAMKYQPEKARQLLAEAGYPSGFKMEVIVESVADRIDELSLIKDYLAKIGVALDIQPKESGVFASISQGKTHKETIYTGAGAMHYDWESWRPGAPANVGMINNPAVNKAITEFSNYFFISDDKAFRIMRETVVYIAEQFWVVPFPSPHEYVIWQPWLKGFHGEYMSGTVNQFSFTTFAWVDQELKKSLGF